MKWAPYLPEGEIRVGAPDGFSAQGKFILPSVAGVREGD